jgi:hypothetical protein
MRALILAETGHCTIDAVTAAAAVIDADCVHVTVAAVAEPDSPWAASAAIGNSCHVCAPVPGIEDDLVRSGKPLQLAARAACCAVVAVPVSVQVTHCAAADWCIAIAMACEYDLVVVASAPSRIRDRRLLRKISRRGVRLVTVGRGATR